MVHILKANGEKEMFSEEKLFHSIHRAGISRTLEPRVIEHIKKKLYENIPTNEIYHHITEFLRTSEQPFTKARYSLKQAIMDLGPTGYPFEDYVAKMLTLQGYQTQTRQVLQGKCITHEIDVIAEKNTVLPNKIMVEAKFHNQVGLRTNVHVSLYTKARFDDIKEKHTFTEGLLITNTKATGDAIAYAECMGMKIITWSYPERESLRDFVEKFHLYPITSLTTLEAPQKQQLLAKGIVLCKDVCENHALLHDLNIAEQQTQAVIEEVEFICKVKDE